ncbi:MAG: hypothetical protein HGA45_06880 [Chloroflexales bacterium]|nr:hypothetical protein [Chloroflexales bacterium]
MSSVDHPLASLVAVDAGFKPAVHLPDHFNDDEQNAQLIRTYIPTSQSISFLAEVARSLNPASDQRARMLHGTFGTGKSDLLLMLCNYFSRPADDPIMQPFYEKLQRINEAQYTTIHQQRVNKKPFLVVLLQANAVTPFPGFILHGLEQALKDAGLEDLMLPTCYSAARQKLEEWQQNGHPVLQSFITALRDNEAKELSTLVTELSGPGAGSVFAAFQRAFHVATGTHFDIYSYDRPHETYKRVAQALRERGSHSGIVVVCDEFTEVLRRMARAGDQQAAEVEVEALGVQDLASTSLASGPNQLHFVVASLDTFASAAAESPSDPGSKVIEKIGGRFKLFALDLQDSAELIRGAIKRLDATVVLPNRQRDELVDLARSLWGQQGKHWAAEMVVDGCFPLHPMVTYALPLINRLVAQTNRTMFQFLKDKDGLGSFLAQYSLASPYSDWSNLLTIDWLFDYFEKSIQVRRSDITDAYNHGLQLLTNVNVDTALARRVLKAIAVCEVVAPTLSPTRQMLRHALNLPPSAQAELLAALTLLEQIEAVYPPNDAEGEALGAYSLPMSGRVSSVNLRQRVIRKARELQPSIARLQAAYPAEAVKAEEYNRRRGSYRELKAKYVGMVELNSAARLKEDLTNARDGLLWYMIASSESERSDAQSRARELTRQHPRLVIAVPIGPLNVLEALKNYEALDMIRGDSALDSSAKTYLQDTHLVGKGFYTALTAAVAKLREEKQWEWFRDGASQPNIINRAQSQDLASKMMTAIYLHTPEHQLGQHFKAEVYTANLTSAMMEVLKGDLRISKSDKKAGEVIRNAMAGLGLVKLIRTEGAYEIFSLVEPTTNYNSQKIWQLYRSHLSAGKPWRKLIDTLREPPYGLYDSLLFAFTGAFFTFYADAIEVTTATGPAQQAVSLDEKALKGLIENPQNYNVRLQPLSDLEKQWLRGAITEGLKKHFDPAGGQGKTLRSRVAAQVKTWLSSQRLPLFAEKLDAAQLASLMPESAGPAIAAACILLQGSRTDEAIASVLLKEIPEALRAPGDHTVWTSESVQELLALWGETCRLVERLAGVLEQHAVRAVVTVFGYEHKPAEEYWSHIYHWRLNRQVVQSQASDLSRYTRELFSQTYRPSVTVSEAILDGFARVIVGINTAYHTWSTLDHLDRLVKELQKARAEIEHRWNALASEAEVWHNGVASAALGRTVVGIQAENADRTASHLFEWATGRPWPTCAPTLQPAELKHLYPTADEQARTDLCAILKRTQYGAEDWKREVGTILPRQFGVEGWTKAEVEQGVSRLGAALKHAENLDALLRKHTLTRVLKPFASTDSGSLAPGATLRAWLEAHAVPPENDLDETARILLGQIEGSSDAETTLLFSLPLALPQIAQGYQQWRSYAELDRYVGLVAAGVTAVERYEPLTSAELSWLTGIIADVLRRPLASPPREKHRLAQAVAAQTAGWLREQRLPAFAAKLTATDLGDLLPDASPPQIETMLELLRANGRMSAEPAGFFLADLPCTLGVDDPSASWGEAVADGLIADLGTVCGWIHRLQDVMTRRLLNEIGPVFGVEATDSSASILVAKLRAWRQSYVLFANETLSPDAALVSETLSAPADDPLTLLFTTLPGKLREVRAPYGSWCSWDLRVTYLRALEAAAAEIAQRGRVSDATPQVQALWESFKSHIVGLSQDEQRWLIKAFNEEFRA